MHTSMILLRGIGRLTLPLPTFIEAMRFRRIKYGLRSCLADGNLRSTGRHRSHGIHPAPPVILWKRHILSSKMWQRSLSISEVPFSLGGFTSLVRFLLRLARSYGEYYILLSGPHACPSVVQSNGFRFSAPFAFSSTRSSWIL